VYKARHLPTGSIVAMKIMEPDEGTQPPTETDALSFESQSPINASPSIV
jgi:hypothetical protein